MRDAYACAGRPIQAHRVGRVDRGGRAVNRPRWIGFFRQAAMTRARSQGMLVVRARGQRARIRAGTLPSPVLSGDSRPCAFTSGGRPEMVPGRARSRSRRSSRHVGAAGVDEGNNRVLTGDTRPTYALL